MSLNELDKFTRIFIQKSIQVIVQSRLGGERLQTRCDPRGKDWFNLSIPDDREVTERIQKCFDTIASDFDGQRLTVTRGWQVCCEISLKNSDGESMVLEYWLFTNESLVSSPRARVTDAKDEVFTIFNRLTLLLKSIITLTRATPIYKISNSGQGPETFVICYRIFDTAGPIEDLIEQKDKNRYSRVIRLGNVSSQCSRIAVSFSYRTNMATCNDDKSQTGPLMPVKMDHFKTESPDSDADFSCNRKILAFASPKSEYWQENVIRFFFHLGIYIFRLESSIDASILVPENAFVNLLVKKAAAVDQGKKEAGTNATVTRSEEKGTQQQKSGDMTDSRQKSGSACPESVSEESFVFVEAPFASPEEKVLGSFFNGPSPGFLESEKLPLQLNELTAEIEAIESSVDQWDSFVESVCSEDCGESVTTPTKF